MTTLTQVNTDFATKGYVKIDNLLSYEDSARLAKAFTFYLEEIGNPMDTQCPLSYCAYNYLPFVELLIRLTPYVSAMTGTSVLPTYSYARRYRTGEVLHQHTDRDSCEISLTITLRKNGDWPIYMNGESIELGVGDAAMYRGCEIEHWREQLQSDDQVQVFLHYVDARGSRSKHYFDRVNTAERGLVNEY